LVVDRGPGYRGDGDGGADGEQDGQIGRGVEAQEGVSWKDGGAKSHGIKEVEHDVSWGRKV